MDIFHFTDEKAYSQMFQQCQDFVAKYITDIARTSAFLFLTPAELAGILAIHSIDLASDSVLFDSLLHWFQHDPTARQRHLYKLYHGKSAPPVLTHLPLTVTPPDLLTSPCVSPVMCIQNPYYNCSYATGVLLPPIPPCVCNSTNVNHFPTGLQPPAIATPVAPIPFLPKTFHHLTTDSF